MREELIEGCSGLLIQRSRTDNPCAYSGSTIGEGEHAVSVRIKVNGHSYLAWISIGAVDGVISALESFDASENSVRKVLSPSEQIKYNRVKGEQLRCAVCDTHMPKGSEGISFHNPKGHRTQTAWTHIDCIPEVIEGLSNVWEYSDVLLAEQV